MAESQMTLASKKLKALKEGIVTDVVFLVGATDATAQEIRAIGSDLVVSSEFFVSLLDSPLTVKRDGKIRLKNVEPKVFQLLIEVTHLSGQLVSEVDSLDTCLQLAVAADEYMIDELGSVCSKLLEDQFLTVDNVWTVLSENFMVEAVASACLKVLGSKASDCLKHPSFLEASEEAVKLFCMLDNLSIGSESELLAAFLEYINTKRNQREFFRQCFLPCLRLLALDSADLAKVFPMLTLEEKTSIAAWKSPLMAEEKPQLASGLCPISKQRLEIIEIPGQQTLNLVSDKHVLGVRDVFSAGHYFTCIFDVCESLIGGPARCWVSLELCPKRSVKISGFELFNVLDFTRGGLRDSTKTNYLFQNPSGRFVQMTSTVDDQRTRVSHCLYEVVELPVHNFPLDGWTFVKHAVGVPAGGSFTLKVFFTAFCVLRTKKFTEDLVKSINSNSAVDAFSKIEISHNIKLSEHLNKNFPADTKLCIFKSIKFIDNEI